MSKEKIIEEYRAGLHRIATARTEEEIEDLFEETERLLVENCTVFTAQEYANDLATLRIYTWKARSKIQEGI